MKDQSRPIPLEHSQPIVKTRKTPGIVAIYVHDVNDLIPLKRAPLPAPLVSSRVLTATQLFSGK